MMNAGQYARRQEFLVEIHSAVEGLAEPSKSWFLSRLREVVQGLEALVYEVDGTSSDRLERARSWRFLGNAYALLGAEGSGEEFERAKMALEHAERILEGIEIPNERMKLIYSQGHLLHLSVGQVAPRRACIENAARKYAEALGVARAERQVLAEPIEEALMMAGREIELLDRTHSLLAEAVRDRRTPSSPEEESDTEDMAPIDPKLFENLLQVCSEIQQIQSACSQCETPGARALLWL